MSRQIAMGAPARIQRRRIKGWRAPAGAVYVGRGSRWGNPYAVTGDTVVDTRTGGVIYAGGTQHAARRAAVTWYRAWLGSQDDLRAAARRVLAGRDLMCWCPLPTPGQPDHCHAAVLLEIANGGGAR
jgi:hypothetical protein